MKTEPNYFRRLIITFRLSNANIHVAQSPGSDPVSIVTYAENEFAKGEYDRVFCVFDRDGHANFDAALARLVNSEGGKAGKIQAVFSWPCFEYWILLHFVFTTQAFVAVGGRSSCDNVIREIRAHMPNFAKGHATIFDDLADRMQVAIANAKRVARHNRTTNSTNPATWVHDLVEYLQKLRAQ